MSGLFPDVKPGDVVVLEDGRRLLVGDINPNFGRCDCCIGAWPKEVVRVEPAAWVPASKDADEAEARRALRGPGGV